MNKCFSHVTSMALFGTRFATLLIIPLLLLHAMPRRGECAPNSDSALRVFVSIPPQAYFVETIGKAHVACSVMVEPGHSPATYEPTAKQIAALGRAQLYFRIGVPFEDVWMKRIQAANPNMDIVDTVKGIDLQPAARHHHDHGRHQRNGRMDPHVWLSIKAAKVLAQNICEALITKDPAHTPFYQKNLTALIGELNHVDRRIRDVLKPLKRRKFIAFHPAWGYFARDYNLVQIPIELEGKDPDARSLSRLIELAEAEDIRLVVVQEQFSTRSAEVIAQIIGAPVVQLNPLARDYPANMERIAQTLRGAMK